MLVIHRYMKPNSILIYAVLWFAQLCVCFRVFLCKYLIFWVVHILIHFSDSHVCWLACLPLTFFWWTIIRIWESPDIFVVRRCILESMQMADHTWRKVTETMTFFFIKARFLVKQRKWIPLSKQLKKENWIQNSGS